MPGARDMLDTLRRDRWLVAGVVVVVAIVAAGTGIVLGGGVEAHRLVGIGRSSAAEPARAPVAVLEIGRTADDRELLAERADVPAVERGEVSVRIAQAPPGARIADRPDVVRVSVHAGSRGEARRLVDAATELTVERLGSEPQRARALGTPDVRAPGRNDRALVCIAATWLGLVAGGLLVIVRTDRRARR